MHLNFNPLESGSVVPFTLGFFAIILQSIAQLNHPILESITPYLAFTSALLGVLYSIYRWYQTFVDRKHEFSSMKSTQALHSESLDELQKTVADLRKKNAYYKQLAGEFEEMKKGN